MCSTWSKPLQLLLEYEESDCGKTNNIQQINLQFWRIYTIKVVILVDGFGGISAFSHISQLDLGPRWLLLPEPELQDRGEADTDDESGNSDSAGRRRNLLGKL